MPLPNAALWTSPATPILHTARVTHGTGGRPLILEQLCASADHAQYAYSITANATHYLHAI